MPEPTQNRRIAIPITLEQRRLIDKFVPHGIQGKFFQALIHGILQKLKKSLTPHQVIGAMLANMDLVDAFIQSETDNDTGEPKAKPATARGSASVRPHHENSSVAADSEDVEATGDGSGDGGDPTDFFGYSWPKERL